MTVGEDSPVWTFSSDGNFSVSSCYGALCSGYITFDPLNRYDIAFSLIWKVQVPLKVRFFGWRCLMDKILSKEKLLHRGSLNFVSNSACVFCNGVLESSSHLLLNCRVVELVWKDMAEWLELEFNSMNNFREIFLVWRYLCIQKNTKRCRVGSVWLAIIWSLWLCRNCIIFKNNVLERLGCGVEL